MHFELSEYPNSGFSDSWLQQLVNTTSDVDFFFKPDDIKCPATKIGVDPYNGTSSRGNRGGFFHGKRIRAN